MPAKGERDIEAVKAHKFADEAPPANGEHKPPVKPPAKPSRLSVADTALNDFTARVLDLVRRIGNHDAERFADAAVKADELLK
jgi:hypothetical protein